MAKRGQNGSAPPNATSGRRRSQRTTTGKTSTYFENDDESDSDGASPEQPPQKVARTKGSKTGSSSNGRGGRHTNEAAGRVGDDDDDDDFQDKSEDDPEDDDDDDDEPEFDDDEGDSDHAAGNKPSKVVHRAKPSAGKGQDNGSVKRRNGHPKDGNDDEEDEDDEESRVTFIPLPKLRADDGIDYEPERIHPNTLLFLKDLKANNKRSWLKLHDEEYRRSLKDWESFVETITEKITEVDETVPELPLKDVIFRIYRDVRFSKDQTPYKAHYAAAWSRTGRKGPYACYYVHVEPQRCLVGGGLWCPDKDALARLRASVDERPNRIRRVLMEPSFRKTFLPKAAELKQKMGKKQKSNGKSNGEVDEAAAVVRAFAEGNKESALKTKPKGFDADHRDIELLKLKNYTVSKKFNDEDLTAPDAQDRIMDAIKALFGFVTFINSVVLPDPGDDSDSEVEGEEEEGDE